MKPSLTLLTGWNFMPQSMQALADHLKKDYEVRILDSAASLNHLQEQIPPHSTVLGWSLGGAVALQLATLIPLKKIILLATNPCFIANDEWPGMTFKDFQKFEQALHSNPTETLKKFAYLQVQGMKNLNHAYPKIHKHLKTSCDSLEPLKKDYCHLLKTLSCELHVLLAEKDALIPSTLASSLQKLKPNTQISILKNLPHAGVILEPGAIAELISPTLGDETQKHKQKIKACFNKAAPHYDQAAQLQHRIGAHLLQKIKHLSLSPRCLIDLGAGTGYCTQELSRIYPDAETWGIDFAPKMLKTACQHPHPPKLHYLLADFDHLPFPEQYFDLVFSNFSLQWSVNFEKTLSSIHRSLKPGGYCVFSMPGPSSLQELRDTFKAIDQETHLNNFLSASSLQTHFKKHHFKKIEIETTSDILQFKTIYEVLHHLKNVGANYVFHQERSGLKTKHYFEKLAHHYEAYRQHHHLPLHYEIIYGIFKK